MKQTHVQGGVLLALSTSPIVMCRFLGDINPIILLIMTAPYVIGSYFGSMLADIDMKSSYISKKIRPLYWLIGKRFKHRGATHSLLSILVLIIVMLIVYMLTDSKIIIPAFMIGVIVGHI